MTGPLLRHLRASAFERLHLCRNPFGELSREERADAACVETEAAAAFLNDGRRGERRALQFVADHGRGKSTHLIALHARSFPEAPYTQLHEGSPVPEPQPTARVDFIDSIETLRWLERRALYRRCETLACTTHRDLGRELRRAGYEVLTVQVGIQSTHDLSIIAHARLAAASLSTGSPPSPSEELLGRLHAEFGDDVRSIEHALYAEYEHLRSTAPPLAMRE
ncbi:MAG: hypothetical protein ACJA2W_001429 [Planctomycetota bacterium]